MAETGQNRKAQGVGDREKVDLVVVLRDTQAFMGYVWRRFSRDRCLRVA